MFVKENPDRKKIYILIESRLMSLRKVREAVYLTIENPAFCLALYLTGVHFRRKLQHVGDVIEQKIKCRPIRTQEVDGIRL